VQLVVLRGRSGGPAEGTVTIVHPQGCSLRGLRIDSDLPGIKVRGCSSSGCDVSKVTIIVAPRDGRKSQRASLRLFTDCQSEPIAIECLIDWSEAEQATVGKAINLHPMSEGSLSSQLRGAL
jgi:hypothetical protein